MDVGGRSYEERYEQIAALLLASRANEPMDWGEISHLGGDPCSMKIANRFLLCCLLDYQILSEVAWRNGYRLIEDLGDPDDVWRGEIETSLTATKTIVEALQDRFAAGDKAIVIVSSINGELIAGYLPIGYHVAKAALQQMVRYWALALGSRGIRVNSVSPGTVLKEESKQFFLRDRKLSDLYRRITPLGRFGHAREVARVIGCLCGEQTSFVTGQDIVVDGGVSLQWQESLARELVNLATFRNSKPAKARRK